MHHVPMAGLTICRWGLHAASRRRDAPPNRPTRGRVGSRAALLTPVNQAHATAK